MLRWTCVVAAIYACAGAPAFAVSRLGAATDDSVCDVGSTDRRAAGVMPPREFVKSKCRNGQVLLGISVVPVGTSQSEIAELASRYCLIAGIQSSRSMSNMAGIAMEYEQVRCVIEKMPSQAASGPK